MKLILIILLLLFPFDYIAQSTHATYKIEGQVRVKKTGELLEGAKIELIVSTKDTITLFSNSEGEFICNLDTIKRFKIIISKSDYKTIIREELGTKKDTSITYFHLFELFSAHQGCSSPPPIYFNLNNDIIVDSSFIDLELLKELMIDNPTMNVQFIGTVDYDEDTTLALNRALRVKKWFVKQGINQNRIIAIGDTNQKIYKKPDKNSSNKNWSMNRKYNRACYMVNL